MDIIPLGFPFSNQLDGQRIVPYNGPEMGTLYLVATPIGNLEDTSLRALRILGEVRLIAAEDTRRARHLLSRYQIQTPVTSYYRDNELEKLGHLLEELEQGDLALISEAGMPTISDPGRLLVEAALERDIPVVPIPGPSAITSALAASGIPSDEFLYLGFLPRRAARRQGLLERVAGEPYTLVAFEAPHRLRETLEDMRHLWGERRAAIARELTKLHEEVLRGTLSELAEHFQRVEPRGEFTIVVEGGREKGIRPDQTALHEALVELQEQGVSLRDGARILAKATSLPRRQIYQLGLEEPQGSSNLNAEEGP